MSKFGMEEKIQHEYYSNTAVHYDELHLSEKDEHYFAASYLAGMLDFLDAKTVLDVGSGTGRIVSMFKKKHPHIHIVGIEPVLELREIGYQKGLTKNDLIEGNGLALPFGPEEFDLVCAFGVLHHVSTPALVISEMLRVAKTAIFISDCNNFGQGSSGVRVIKQMMDYLRLWPLVNWIKTRGRGCAGSP
jgi:ubiquinone/menaquinone biosynthesis C-methylase UbiE